jgi:indolepyruvate ferredoxin oxidoreductase beta subunit
MGGGIASPLISEGGADVVIAFEPGEAVRAAPYLKPDGAMIVSDRAILPAASGGYEPALALEWLEGNIGNLLVVSGKDVLTHCGARGLNVALLGAAAAMGCLPFGAKGLEAAIRVRLPEKFVDANLAALAYGAEAVRGVMRQKNRCGCKKASIETT